MDFNFPGRERRWGSTELLGGAINSTLLSSLDTSVFACKLAGRLTRRSLGLHAELTRISEVDPALLKASGVCPLTIGTVPPRAFCWAQMEVVQGRGRQK